VVEANYDRANQVDAVLKCQSVLEGVGTEKNGFRALRG